LLIIDDLCRTLTSLEIPIGVITGIVGIPVFLYFILREKVSWA
ncbi:MAG: iron chelate uptake ABC transporter family permease subunit, partial [Oscillospiraceae bacterium]|nr:iron chelate uptake ABC transporter family permease subunit [Oscillospiraceae bacterium]